MLAEIFAKYPDTDKNTIHSYAPVYESLFADRRLDVKRVLEIGVRRGGSLKAWAEYFPNAQIVGLDSGEECGVWASDDPRITVVQGDSTKIETYADRSLFMQYPGFDVIIDDGSHKPKDQEATFRSLMTVCALAPGGVYVIEDLEGIHPAQEVNSFVGGEIIDRRHVKDRHDDILIVYRG